MTTRDAIAGLVRALEAIALVRQFDGKSICARCNLTLPACDRSGCAGAPARAALASWNAREPLRESGDLWNNLTDAFKPVDAELLKNVHVSTFRRIIAVIDDMFPATPVPGTQETR